MQASLYLDHLFPMSYLSLNARIFNRFKAGYSDFEISLEIFYYKVITTSCDSMLSLRYLGELTLNCRLKNCFFFHLKNYSSNKTANCQYYIALFYIKHYILE